MTPPSTRSIESENHDNVPVTESRISSTSCTSSASTSTKLHAAARFLDASSLDGYLQRLVGFDDVLNHKLPSELQAYKHTSILQAMLRCVLLCYFQAQSPAQQILGMKLVESTPSTTITKTASIRPIKNGISPFKRRLIVYSILATIVPSAYQYLKTKWFLCHGQINHDHGGGDDGISVCRGLARKRKYTIIRRFFQTIDTIIPMLRLGLLLSLWSSSASTATTQIKATVKGLLKVVPSLAMTLAGLHYEYGDVHRHNESTASSASQRTSQYPTNAQYAHRRWLQEEASRLFPTVILPLLNSSREIQTLYLDAYRRAIARPLNSLLKFSWRSRHKGSSAAGTTNKEECAACKLKDIVIPSKASCGHVYCYTCLWARKQSRAGNEDVLCLSCYEKL